jgi:Na+/melibiose symporter-like transporter
LTLIISIICNPISDRLERVLGSKTLFMIGSVWCALAVLVIWSVFRSQAAPAKKTESVGYGTVLATLTASRDRKLICILLIDLCYAGMPFMFNASITSFFHGQGLPNGVLLGSITLWNLIGAQLTNYLKGTRSPIVIATFCFAVYAVNDVLMAACFERKMLLYAMLGGAGCCDGCLSGLVLAFRQHYPRDIRGHLLGLMRLLTSVLSSVAIHITAKKDKSTQLLSCAAVLAVCAVLSTFVWIIDRRKAKVHQE